MLMYFLICMEQRVFWYSVKILKQFLSCQESKELSMNESAWELPWQQFSFLWNQSSSDFAPEIPQFQEDLKFSLHLNIHYVIHTFLILQDYLTRNHFQRSINRHTTSCFSLPQDEKQVNKNPSCAHSTISLSLSIPFLGYKSVHVCV